MDLKRLFFLLILIPLGLFAQTIITGKVVAVKDGDTIEILLEGNKVVRVRLASIDCPESKQDYGQKAKQFTSDQCFSKTVTAKQTDTDRYGRTVAFVYLPDGKCLNEILLINGLAWHYKRYSQDSGLAKMEDTARNEKKGLWSTENPIAPWEFRKK